MMEFTFVDNTLASCSVSWVQTVQGGLHDGLEVYTVEPLPKRIQIDDVVYRVVVEACDPRVAPDSIGYLVMERK